MNTDVSTLSDYVAIFRRRSLLLFGSAFGILLAFVTLAYTLPAVYHSAGTILIEQQDVPAELVPSTVTSYAAERIQIVSQRVMTSATLASIIDEYDLYPADRDAGAITTDMVDEFRADTTLETVSAEVSDSRGRAFDTTIAFMVGYNGGTPQTAKKVATELVDLYLQENARSRAEAATDTSEFLAKRAALLDEDLNRLEQDLAQFKERHGDSLPELLRLNTDRLDASDRQIDTVEREIRTLKDSRSMLESELAVTNPFAAYDGAGDGMMTAPRRLDELQREYITLAARYGPKHPDLIRVRKEIELLTGGAVSAALGAMEERLYDLKIELQTIKQRYSPDHPDVASIERQIASLEQERSQILERSSQDLQPTNALYIQKQGALTAAKNELAAAQARLRDLIGKRDSYESRLLNAPQVEREYSALTREYEAKLLQFRDIEDKRETALLAESLELEQKGERFILVEPAKTPRDPVSPNRLAILLLGTVVAAGVGMGLATLSDAVDTTVRGSKDIINLFDAPPLASIMYVENVGDVQRRFKRNAIVVGSAFAGVALVSLVVFTAG